MLTMYCFVELSRSTVIAGTGHEGRSRWTSRVRVLEADESARRCDFSSFSHGSVGLLAFSSIDMRPKVVVPCP